MLKRLRCCIFLLLRRVSLTPASSSFSGKRFSYQKAQMALRAFYFSAKKNREGLTADVAERERLKSRRGGTLKMVNQLSIISWFIQTSLTFGKLLSQMNEWNPQVFNAKQMLYEN